MRFSFSSAKFGILGRAVRSALPTLCMWFSWRDLSKVFGRLVFFKAGRSLVGMLLSVACLCVPLRSSWDFFVFLSLCIVVLGLFKALRGAHPFSQYWAIGLSCCTSFLIMAPKGIGVRRNAVVGDLGSNSTSAASAEPSNITVSSICMGVLGISMVGERGSNSDNVSTLACLLTGSGVLWAGIALLSLNDLLR